MNDFILSLQPFWKQYRIEILLIIIAGALALGVIFIAASSSKTGVSDKFMIEKKSTTANKIIVAIEGAVVKPGVYTFDAGARINDVIKKAGGLTEDADDIYIRKQINMAKKVEDQEKIYLPFVNDTDDNNIDYSLSQQLESTSSNDSITGLISINSANLSELDTLPGIGPITAQKIIDGRPYTDVEDLLAGKVVKTNVFEEIRSLIVL